MSYKNILNAFQKDTCLSSHATSLIYFLGIEDGHGQQQQLTRSQLIIEQDSRLPTNLAAKKASCLDSESIIMTQLQVGDFKEIVSSIPKVSCDIHGTIKHVYLVALKTNTGGIAQEVK